MTHRLYHDDAYTRQFTARVTDVQQRPDGLWLLLDRTAFYPTGGGQPHDEGTLTAGGVTANVLDVLADADERVWHRVDSLLPVGTNVEGHIDWDRRFDHMQQHGGEHVLAGSVKQLFGGFTHGLHIGRELSTIDITLPDGRTRLTHDEVTRLEDLANRRVQLNAPVKAWFPEEEALHSLPLRKDPTVQQHVRVVAVGDFEYCACGGTHPSATGQIGVIKVLDTQPARGKLRLSFVCGMRAVRLGRAVYAAAWEAGRLLSAPPEHLAREVLRQQEEMQTLRDQLRALRLDAAHAAAEQLMRDAVSLPGGGLVAAGHCPALDADSLKEAAAQIIKDERAIALLSASREGGVALLFARGSQAPGDMAALLRHTGARGGGKADWAQGSAAETGLVKRAAEELMKDPFNIVNQPKEQA